MLTAHARQEPVDLPSPQPPPVRAGAHHGPSAPGPRHGTALCLSGGGFRAALFHLGAVRRLDELGVLGRLRTVSAVSGGAVVANLLAHPGLEWPDPRGAPGRVGGLEELVAEPLRRLTGTNVRTAAVLAGLSRVGRPDPSTASLADRLERAVPWWVADLREHRRGGPAILTGATEIGYGVSWLFADAASVGPRGRIGDDRLGHAAPPPGLRIVDAVAASCAYPPFLAPMELDGRVLGLVGGTADPDEPGEVREAILRRIQLVDGGVYDNLGVERVWSDHATVLVSDGGAVFRGRAVATVVSRLWHVLSVAGSGGQATRLRWLRAALSAGDLQGAAWSLGSPAGGSPGRVAEINRIRTDLDAFTAGEQMVLERHGYLVADASVRRHSPQVVALEAPTAPPHPEVADDAVVSGLLAGSARVTARGRR